jgi:outer membrane autotransporter protein
MTADARKSANCVCSDSSKQLWISCRHLGHLLSSSSLAALGIWASSQDALAACPVGIVTATFTLSNLDSCPNGLQAGAGGAITVPSGATVTLPGPAGASASDGGTINFSGTTTITLSNNTSGIVANAGSVVTIDGATTITNNQIGNNITRSMLADGGVINGAARPTITATALVGDPSAAVYAVNRGQITFANGFVAAGAGSNASTVTADGVGSLVDARHGSQITMTSDGTNNSEGVQMLRGGLVKLDATTTLTAIGPQAAGLKIDGTTVPFGTMDGLRVDVVGAAGSTATAIGLWATNQISGPSTVNVDGLTVTGAAPVTLGLFTIASTINARNSNITVNGTSGVGAAAALNGGTINLTNSTLTLNGAGAGAVRARNQFGAAATNIFTASGGSITSLQAPALIAQGGLLNATLSNGVTVTGNGRLVSAVAGPLVPGDPSTNVPSTINLVATTGAIINGDAFAEPASTVNVSLESGAKWKGAALNATNVTVGSGTTWGMTANSTVSQTVTNAGLIQFGDFMTLTTRNYVGAGGTIALNTFLGADGSPSDKLIINGGSATDNSALRITNAGGPGAATVANGVAVVQAINDGTTAPGAFTLAGGEVRAGAFDYRLFRGGLDPSSSPNDWFLRSSFVVGPVPPILPPVLPPEPPPEPLPPGVFPIIGPEIATYGVVQPIARQLGMTTLGTLHERIGDTSLAANMGTPCPPDGDPRDGMLRKAPGKAPTNCLNTGWGPSVWGRVLGQQIDNHYRAFADPRASGQLLGFQSGVDIWRGEWLPGHRDAAGFYVGYANANVDVSGLVTNEAATGYVLRHTGGLNLDAWSGAVYWTHYGPGDWYLDAVAQATQYQGSASTQFARLDTSGFGFLTSLETGYPVRLPMFGPGFVLEPQAQIVWQRVSFDDANDGLGTVALGTTSGASGRIGLRGKWTIVSDSGQVWQPYVRANLWRDWGAQATAVYSGVDLVPLLEQATRCNSVVA